MFIRARLYVVMFFSYPKILPMPCGPMRLRTLSSSEPEPQAKSNTLAKCFRLPVFGSWLSSVTIAEMISEVRSDDTVM
jgi:hypothetical protein